MVKSFFSVVVAMAMMMGQSQAEDIKVGMSTALSGPAAGLGSGIKLGVDSYFEKINKAGGVNGNKLVLVALDDGYEPTRAAPNMLQLIEKENVLAVVGNVGTPTAIVTVPIANEKKTLLFGAFTGAGVLRKTPPDRYIINFRASYEDETATMISGLLSIGIKPEEIAFFTQNDGYGDAGYNGAVVALKANGYATPEKLAHGRYERNTTNVEGGLSTILDAETEPRAIIMVGAYAPCAEFIKMAKEEFPDALFLNVSFVGSASLLAALGDQAEGVIVTQVVPNYDASLPGVDDYKKDLAAFSPGQPPDFVSLEGYVAAKIFVEGLKAAPALTREGVIDGIESLSSLDVGIGVPVSYGKEIHQASKRVWPTIIRGGKYADLDWASLRK